MKRRNQIFSIYWRELFAYFNSPIAYIFIVVFVMLTGNLLMSNFFLSGQANMRYFFVIMPVALSVFIPAITMRLWAEEKRGNTFELLLTFPMQAYKLVLGKYWASLKFFSIALFTTSTIPFMLFALGRPDAGVIIGGYLGVFLLGALYLSLGIFISGFCRDQIVSFILTMVVCFGFYLIGQDLVASSIDGWLPGVGSFLRTHISIGEHYAPFAKGVIDVKDVMYFLSLIVIFLGLNVFVIEERMRPKGKWFLTVAVVISLTIAALMNALLFDLSLGRFDLTEAKLYTVTDASKRILSRLDAPVTLKLYISSRRKMPTQYQSLEQDITDKLDELVLASGGHLAYQVVHMETAGEDLETEEETLEKKVQRQGVRPFHVKSIDQDELDIKLIYSAIGIAYKEKPEDVISQVVPQSMPNLEFNVVSTIYRMMLDAPPSIALVAPYSERALDPQLREALKQYGALPQQMREDRFRALEGGLKFEEYGVHRIRLTKNEPIPEGVNTLVILSPEQLNERQKFEISRFLHEGGNVFIAVQEYEYDYEQRGRGVSITPKRMRHGMYRFLENYGLKLSNKMLMDESHEVINVRGGANRGPYAMSTPIKSPVQIVVQESAMNHDVSITGHLSSMIYMWGSALEIDDAKLAELALERTDLFSTTPKSWQVSYHNGELTPEELIKTDAVYDGVLPLSVMLSGQFPDAYADKEVPLWPEEQKLPEEERPAPEQVSLTPGQGKLIVVGSSKMFEDGFVKHGGSAHFFMNAIDSMALGADLIHIRSHQPVDRRLKKLSKADRLFYRFLVIFFVPLVVVIGGSVRAFMRAKEKQMYMKQWARHGEDRA